MPLFCPVAGLLGGLLWPVLVVSFDWIPFWWSGWPFVGLPGSGHDRALCWLWGSFFVVSLSGASRVGFLEHLRRV